MEIKLSQVASVYSGKVGKCCCGCSGSHRYSPQHVAWAGKNRGYPIEATEINEKQVKRVVKIVSESPVAKDEDDYIFTEIGERLYIVYLVH